MHCRSELRLPGPGAARAPPLGCRADADGTLPYLAHVRDGGQRCMRIYPSPFFAIEQHR